MPSGGQSCSLSWKLRNNAIELGDAYSIVGSSGKYFLRVGGSDSLLMGNLSGADIFRCWSFLMLALFSKKLWRWFLFQLIGAVRFL